jgi:hypothetical protein
VTLSAESHEYSGGVRVVALDSVFVDDIDQPAARRWIEHALHEQMMRLSVGWDDDEERLSFTAAPDDLEHPRGLRVHVHGGDLPTWYRIRHERICLICREIPGQWRRQTCVEVWRDLPDGRVLPEVYVITHFTRQSSVGGVQIYRDQYIEVDDVWLPAVRTITTAESGEMRTRSLWLTAHRLTRVTRD